MNQLEFTVTGNRLSLDEDVYSTGGSVNYDRCSFDFSEEWEGLERTAVFGIGRDSYRVPLDENDACFIPAPCMEKEGLITIGVYGTDEETVIATNAISHHIDEGIDDLGEWFEEDYSLVLNAISSMENRFSQCLAEFTESFNELIGDGDDGEDDDGTAVCGFPDDWYKPEPFEGAEDFEDISLGGSYEAFFEYKFNAMCEDFPDYVSREEIGTDTAGELPVYAFTFEPQNYEKTVLITACAHGCEDMMFFALASFFDDMCRKSGADRTLSYLKSRVKFVVIPVISPHSLVTGEAYNENDVDIGFNFPYRWDDCTKAVKGTSAADQTETQNIIDFAEMLQTDKLCAAVDLHVSPITVAGKCIFYPRFKDNCVAALAGFLNSFNSKTDSEDEASGILAASVNPTLANYLADTYGINTCEAVWADELYGGAYDDRNYTMLTEFLANLFCTMINNSDAVCKCGAQPFTKYISWKCDDDAFAVPDSQNPTVMGISNYKFALSVPCILSLTGYAVVNVTDACTVKICPVLYQDYSPEQTLGSRLGASQFTVEVPLEAGVHVIPVSSVLQAYYTSYNSSSRTQYCGDVHAALAFSASDASSAEVQAYSLTLSGIPSDYGKAVEISSPIGESSDYSADDVPVQQISYPLGTYTLMDSKFSD